MPSRLTSTSSFDASRITLSFVLEGSSLRCRLRALRHPTTAATNAATAAAATAAAATTTSASPNLFPRDVAGNW